MSKSGKANFGFDEDFEAQLEAASRADRQPARTSTMGTIIRSTAEASRRRFDEAPEVERKKLLLAARMAELESRNLNLRLVDLSAIKRDAYTRDRRDVSEEELGELKRSIREIGLANPIRLDEGEDGSLMLNQGLRRLAAFEQLLSETGDARYAQIPALVSPVESREASYRRMVDENLIREQVSFGELAILTLSYAEEVGSDVETAVAQLFSSVDRSKKTHIRRAVRIVEAIGDLIEHPHRIGRRMFESLERKLERRGFVDRLRAVLAEKRGRSPEEEADILSKAAKGLVPTRAEQPEGAAPQRFRIEAEGLGRRFDVAISDDRVTITGKGLAGLDPEAIRAMLETLKDRA